MDNNRSSTSFKCNKGLAVHSQVIKIKQEIEKTKHPSLQLHMRRVLLRDVTPLRSRSPLGLAERAILVGYIYVLVDFLVHAFGGHDLASISPHRFGLLYLYVMKSEGSVSVVLKNEQGNSLLYLTRHTFFPKIKSNTQRHNTTNPSYDTLTRKIKISTSTSYSNSLSGYY
ncbi:hypothetical protein VNO77_00165 [Canavalia gladiata]|uniref:Uncharacterized protein n=1 Tax=Canavalia gladiata TaxID=3824 RepID=A0AAN9MTF0_CANGL